MKKFCQIDGCESPAMREVEVSEKRYADSKRSLCYPCAEAYTIGCQHGDKRHDSTVRKQEVEIGRGNFEPAADQPVKVIFRIWRHKQGGEVIALFPGIAGDVGKPDTCSSYMHTGQHGSADLALSRTVRLATPAEYSDLKTELERIGYKLKIAKRCTAADRAARVEQLKR